MSAVVLIRHEVTVHDPRKAMRTGNLQCRLCGTSGDAESVPGFCPSVDVASCTVAGSEERVRWRIAYLVTEGVVRFYDTTGVVDDWGQLVADFHDHTLHGLKGGSLHIAGVVPEWSIHWHAITVIREWLTSEKFNRITAGAFA